MAFDIEATRARYYSTLFPRGTTQSIQLNSIETCFPHASHPSSLTDSTKLKENMLAALAEIVMIDMRLDNSPDKSDLARLKILDEFNAEVAECIVRKLNSWAKRAEASTAMIGKLAHSPTLIKTRSRENEEISQMKALMPFCVVLSQKIDHIFKRASLESSRPELKSLLEIFSQLPETNTGFTPFGWQPVRITAPFPKPPERASTTATSSYTSPMTQSIEIIPSVVVVDPTLLSVGSAQPDIETASPDTVVIPLPVESAPSDIETASPDTVVIPLPVESAPSDIETASPDAVVLPLPVESAQSDIETASSDAVVLPLPIESAQSNIETASSDAVITPSLVETTPFDITARITVSYPAKEGDKLFIRGIGPGLSWTKGIALEQKDNGIWVFEMTESFKTAFPYKILLNDTSFERGKDHQMELGQNSHLTPRF